MPFTPPSRQTYNRNGFADAVEVVGYNYQEPFYESDHRNFPKRLIYGSEVFPYYSSGTLRTREFLEENPWYIYAENDYAFGYFIWTGVDYLGESSGWPSKGWPTAPFDVCMFEKPYAAFFRAVWKAEPTVSIAVADASLDIDPGKDMWSWPFLASHWTFPQYRGHVLEIHTMTNCEEVELFINGNSVGRRRTADFTNNTIRWRAVYQPGRIEAKGYNGGREVTSYELKTAGAPARIELTADRTQIVADGQDLSHVALRLLDADGNPVATDDRQITVSVEGAGRLLVVDNGDLRDGDSPLRHTKPTCFGRALAVVQSLRQGGTITVIARAEGLPESRITISGR
jgi:beta-galactosidase